MFSIQSETKSYKEQSEGKLRFDLPWSSIAQIIFARQHATSDLFILELEDSTLRVHILVDAGSNHQVFFRFG